MKKRTSAKKVSGGLLGALAIAGGSSAYGAVVPVAPPPNLIFPGGVPNSTSVNWDVNGDGIVDFTFTLATTPITFNGFGIGAHYRATITPAAGDATFGTPVVPAQVGAPAFDAQRFTAGQMIPGSADPVTGQALIASNSYLVFGTYFYRGEFAPNLRGFLGLQFVDAAGTHYGYLETQPDVRVSVLPNFSLQFFSAAYDNSLLTPITAGAVPEPGTLAMLAVGAAGIAGASALRCRKARGVK